MPVDTACSTPLSSPSRTPEPPEPSDLSPRFKLFFSFLEAAIDLTREDTSFSYTKTQEKITGDPDYYLPFRQLSPSKHIVLCDPQGPFSPTKLRTRKGLFDAIIFRLITQASPILLQERRVVFGSPANFELAIEGKGDRHQYCKPNATGQHNRFLNIPHIPVYWENTADWNSIANRPGITLNSLLEWFTGSEGHATRFYGMGPLVGWLLASDYAYAGLVDMPDAREVGKIIFKINAGGRGGLRLLGLDADTASACGESMSNLWDEICDHFDAAEIKEMGLNAITLEHALCKFERLWEVIKQVGLSLVLLSQI